MTYRKSPLAAEVLQDTAALPRRLRSLLVMVDGTKDDATLLESARMIGLDDTCLADLAQRGLIERVPGAAPPPPPPSPAQQFAIDKQVLKEAAVDALGMRAFMFDTALGRCLVPADVPATVKALVELVKDKAPAKSRDVAKRLKSAGLA